MRRPLFNSCFKDEMNHYLDYRINDGFKEVNFYKFLKKFDRFCCEENIIVPIFTKENATRLLKRLENESISTHYSRINGIKQFLIYLKKKEYDVYIVKDVRHQPTDFQPHIYTERQIQHYFEALDNYSSTKIKKDVIQYPVLFRLLYCCAIASN